MSILTDPAYIVPPVPDASRGVAWLRASVARFSSGDAHRRRRALAVALLATIPPDTLADHFAAEAALAARAEGAATAEGAALVEGAADAGGGSGAPHPVAVLARALGIEVPVEWVEEVAQGYQPGTGDQGRADLAVERLVGRLGGVYDEATAARIGVLVQACQATVALIDRSTNASVDDVLRDDPPAPATKRLAPNGEIVWVPLSGDLAFGAGPHACPGRAHALALVRAATARSHAD
ncbi:hypothetical protein [Cryptosporangium sp. NPDC048952]|uniref:hypothetical protein n=1 Tax=Cryptosporangium sp. NPDC048952 TaxID=3363961 RepID=UPI00371234D0